MKKYLFCFGISLSFLTAVSQEAFTLKVKLKNFSSGTPFLSYMKKNSSVIDTSYSTEGGNLVFNGSVDGPVLASFGIRSNSAPTMDTNRRRTPRTTLDFVLTNESITINGDADRLNSAAIKGGSLNKAYLVEKANLDKLVETERIRARKLASEGDSIALRSLEASSFLSAMMNPKLSTQYINTYPESLLGMFYLYMSSTTMSLADLKVAYEKMGPTHKDGLYGAIISDKISGLEATSAGKQAIAIEKVDIAGNPVNLESLKGKYVLLDFWGSWCGPCRASHPHLKSLYTKYKSAGFEIVGIAQEQKTTLEESRAAWKKAIKDDDINWVQVLNNEGIEKSDAVKAYGVSVFPTKLLLDKEGKIIARYIGDTDEINVALNKIFGF
jgi:thiol-disulfide isomerase/thioredoxin